MRFFEFKANMKAALSAATVLLLGVGVATAQQQINLTAAASTAPLPDGSAVPMWGYTCASISGTVPASGSQTCSALNPSAAGMWSPVVITVPFGQNLTINLTNNLPAAVPTSIMIVGQLGGGLGTPGATTPSPDHSSSQSNVTWPIVPDPATPGTPPAQGPRVQSFGTEVAHGVTTALTWSAPLPGTYLLESGTHPSIQGPMGLYGILVVTTPPSGATAGTAYPAGTNATLSPAVRYNADIPLIFSEIDPVQNKAVNTAVGLPEFSETTVWSGLPGGCGNPSTANSGNCYPPAVNYTPLYYLINGVAFNKTNAAGSLFPVNATASPVAGTVLVRMVNAGLHMHVPAIVGSQTGTTTSPAGGFSLIAEDGNRLPGNPRVQSEVFMAAGKTYDVMINVPAAGGSALPVYDRELSLSGNAISRDSGMLAYIGVNGASVPASPAIQAATANPDIYNSVVAGQTLTVSDPGKGVTANDINVFGVHVVGSAPAGLTLNTDGTFTYSGGTATSFTYCGNGATAGPACALVTLGAAPLEAGSGITCSVPNPTYGSNVATTLSIKPPGILAYCKDTAGYPLTVSGATSTTPATAALSGGGNVSIDANGGFTASPLATGTTSFTFVPKNSQGTVGAAATVYLTFPSPTNLAVSVVDGMDKTSPITDYRWIIEEDRTFYVDPNCTTNPPPSGCPLVNITGLDSSTGNPTVNGIVPTFGTNFHTSYMPLVAAGCVGTLACESGQTVDGNPVVCDVGNGICRAGAQQTELNPNQVHLDPTKRYYLTIFPGDAANSFENTNGCLGNANPNCGHGMGGAPISKGQTAVTVYAQPNPFPTAKLAVFVFEDDFPLNGEQDAGGGIDVLATNEPGLGGFNVTLFDDAGGTGDATGQMTYDMFNQPLTNSLAGTIDPATQKDACPISAVSRTVQNADGSTGTSPTGIAGTIVTCPRFESDGKTLSPLAGQVVVANLMPGRYGVVATPAADRIGRGEEWLQTNTLDGQKAHDSFLKIGEAGYFQEYGPAGYHVSIGFANPKVINARLSGVCNGTDPNVTGSNCTNTVTGLVTTERMSRTPDERLYSSGTNDAFAFTQCYVSIGDTDGEDFAFTKCKADGTFSISGLPNGSWRVTVFDQWNDMLVDGLSTPVVLAGGTTDMGQIAMNQWQANIYTSTFFDTNGNGLRDSNESGLSLVATNIRFRDGSYSNFNNTDFSGNAGFNEVFPLFSWYTIETDSTRYKNTGVHVVYDAGGPADGTPGGGSSAGYQFMANTAEPAAVTLPANLHVPGAFYCANADCTDAPAPLAPGGTGGSTGRVDPPWVTSEGWQGFSGQNSFLDFGKKPFVPGETGGIHGEVIYASTRPFDDPALLIHTSWTPDVPGVTVNLYQEGTAADGSTSLILIDTTTTSSWDQWAQGFRSDGVPNMNCPGQTTADQFYFTLYDQPNWLDMYSNGGSPVHTLPNNSQFKCYDGMHNWNQLQPAPYDGAYQFPSITGINPSTGKVTKSNCTACLTNPDASDPYRYGGSTTPVPWTPGAGAPMLPAGKYVVEMVVPPGYELVKEEDKNILIGDNYIAPVTQEFGGLGAIYILPDQAEIGSAFNPNNPQNSTNYLGRTVASSGLPQNEGDTGSVEQFWPCVGAARVVPDFISLFPQSAEVAPFAGATRNLCDRKEVTLTDQTAALAKFWVFTSAHVAAHFTGVITDDFTSEFDPFSPQFGEKFAPPNLPISLKDWTGTETQRVYTDQWGAYDGLTYSTWEVNPPNPTGYAPTMMVTCMNDPGTGATPDALFNPGYSQFCYEIPFMPGQTQYMDTPVTPTTAYSEGYNHPDCSYPDTTPAISKVDGDGMGPWSAGAGGLVLTLTNGGSGYSSAPAVTINNGTTGGSGATASTLINGSVTSLHLTSAGSGYTTLPVVDLVGGGGTGASATAIGTGAVASVKLTSGGAGYSSAPTVNFTGGGGTGAAATALVTGSITGVTITNGGKGYLPVLLPATVTFSGGGGSGAAGTANLSGHVASVVVIPILQVGSYSTNATITATFSAPAPGGTQATGTVNTTTTGTGVNARKHVSTVTITNPGSGYTSAPTVTFTATSGTQFTAASGTALLAYSVVSVTVTSGGSGYTGIPTVTFNTPLGGTRATGTAVETGAVTKITITSGGSGYTSAPTVSINGGGGSGASATDSIAFQLTGLTLTAAGSGYTSAPQVQFVPTDGNGSGAAATDTIAGPVASIVVNNPGSNYGSAPTVTISNGTTGGTGATATAAVSTGKLTITALADQQVLNNGYSGPSATAFPFNAKTITRHYGFGTTPGTVALVGSDGVAHPLTGVVWGASTMTGTIPSNVPACTLQQQAQYGGSAAQCGQLVITTSTGKVSVDTVTVTIGGKSPTRLTSGQTIQSAIDGAAPGDLIIVPPGTYTEMLLMWKPVRLQGVGAPSSIVNSNAQPEGRLDPWRRSVSCLFGLALDGQPLSTPGNLVPAPGAGVAGTGVAAGATEPLNQYDSTGQYGCPGNGWNYFNGGPNNPQVDRIPLEGILGWDTTLNGNLAELLQEPSLMGAYEGAGITVLAKGVRYPSGLEVFGAGQDIDSNANVAHEGQMPARVNADGSLTGTVPLTSSAADCNVLGSGTKSGYTSNFQCNPSRIDGLSITDSSQGGGGIFVHGWAHNLEIANNRIYNNSGTLTGGITVGQGESPDELLSGNNGDPVGFDQQPWTCVQGAITTGSGANQVPNPPGFPTNAQLPYCYNTKVNVHNNSVSLNSSIGDELFSSTPAGAGGITMAVGSDNYNVSNNWVCGNLSTGDGGGVSHLGASFNGTIQHNSILFNQSTNPTVPTNGGGIIVMAAAPDGTLPGAAAGTECGSVTDVDCAPGLPDGTGPGLKIDSNLIMGNSAESGSGGGIRFQSVNGTDIGFFPLQPAQWNSVNVTNNIIANNVAGWDGAGISLQDSLVVNVINNTIISNDTTASSGVLFNTLGAPIASAPGDPNQTTTTGSAPQAAGVVSMRNTSLLTQSTLLVICPTGHGSTLLQTCKNFSVPKLDNDVIWKNRSFYIGVGDFGPGALSQQKLVSLFNSFTTTPAVSQPTADATTANGTGAIITGGTGACVTASYWDVGVRGDTGPTNHSSGMTMAPAYSVLTSLGGSVDYSSALLHNTASDPTVMSQYCNGSRTPPEFKSNGFQVPPGIADATVPNPVFSLSPSATVDEGNNWINLSWGPLALTNPTTNTTLGNYAPASTSSVINYITSTASTYAEAPSVDIFGTARKTNNAVDAGAVEFVAALNTPLANVTGGPLAFGNVPINTTSAAQTLTLHNTGTANVTGIAVTVTTGFATGGTCGTTVTTLAPGATCTITVTFHPTALGAATGTVTITSNVAVTGSPVNLSGTGVAVQNAAAWTPTTYAFPAQTRNCPTPLLGCAADPIEVFTLTNTGNVNITGIGQGVLGGTNPAEFAIGNYILRLAFTTCGTTTTTLAPGATCTVAVKFSPLTAQTTGSKTASLSVTDSAGTQTATMSGQAN